MDRVNIRFQSFQKGFSGYMVIAVVSASNVARSAGSLLAWVPNTEKNILGAVCWKLREGARWGWRKAGDELGGKHS